MFKHSTMTLDQNQLDFLQTESGLSHLWMIVICDVSSKCTLCVRQLMVLFVCPLTHCLESDACL